MSQEASMSAREKQWRRLALRADSMLSLLRHRGGIRFGNPALPAEFEVDRVIGALRLASESGILDADDTP